MGGTRPTEIRGILCAIARGTLGRAIPIPTPNAAPVVSAVLGAPWNLPVEEDGTPARGIGGALWMTGCRELSSVVSRGLMTISAGAGFPLAREARRCVKLIEGGGRA